MVVSIHIGFRYCEKKTISVIVDYSIKARQLNPTTVIYLLDIDLLDKGENKNTVHTFSCSHQRGMQYVVPRFSGEIYSKSPFHRFCFKVYWRF